MPNDKVKIEDKRKIDAITGEPVRDDRRFTGEYDSELIKKVIGISMHLGFDPYTGLAMLMQESNFGQPAESDNNPFGAFGHNNPFYTTAMGNWVAKHFDDDYDKEQRGKKPTEAYLKLKEMYNNAESYYERAGNLAQNLENAGIDENVMSGARSTLMWKQQEVNDTFERIAEPLAYAQKMQEKYKDRPEAYRIQAYNGLNKLTKEYYGGNITHAYGLPLPIDTKENPVYGKRVIDLRDNVIKANSTINELVGEAMRNKMLESLRKNIEPPKFNF